MNHARRDLCGGCPAMGIPTAIIIYCILQQRGLVQRRAGSGTYITEGAGTKAGLLFGLLIPNLAETEIFGPICQGMAEYSQVRNHALLWGDTTPAPEGKETQMSELCRQCWSGSPRRTCPHATSC